VTTVDVLLQGSPFCDLTFTFNADSELPTLGQEVYAADFAVNPGGIFNIVAALSALDLRVGFLTQLGNDMFSRFIGERMRALQIPMDLVTWVDMPLPVVTAGVSFPHDRLFISYAPPPDSVPPAPQITVEMLEDYRPRALFSYGELGSAVYRRARELGVFTYVDTAWHPERLRSAGQREALREVDVVAPNRPEALEMTGAATVEEALDCLARWVDAVVVKLGAEGCRARANGREYCVPPIPVRAIETTGAGDNFNAGFIYGRLRGYDFEDCLRCGNIVGGLSTECVGGCVAAVTPAGVEAWLQKMREGNVRRGA